jgi:ABC-type amino acid transport substrate-binding protein
MKHGHALFILLLAALLSFTVARYGAPPKSVPQTRQDSAFERILRTGTIRCGYYVFPPAVYRDANTNELTGFSVDFMNKLAERAGLKIDWTEEVSFGNWVPALQSNRFDVACTPMWPTLNMLRAVSFTEPLFYSGLSPAVRVDDKRFDNDLARLNEPDVTFVTIEGNMTDTVTREAFPKARFTTVPASAEAAFYFETILTGKADTGLTDRNGLKMVKDANGAAPLRLIDPAHPVKLQSFPLAIGLNELELKNFLDQGIREMNDNGEIDRLLRKWEDESGLTYLRVAQPFAAPKE